MIEARVSVPLLAFRAISGDGHGVLQGEDGWWWQELRAFGGANVGGDSDSVNASGAKGPVYQGCEDIVVWRLSVAGTLELWNGR